MNDLKKIQVLGEVIDYIDFVETEEQKANDYKALKDNLKA